MTKELAEIDRRTVWHPYTKRSHLEAGPLPVIVRGEGVYLYDRDGRRYVDVISSWWAAALGHSHPRIVEAIRRQAGELQHSILGNLTHPRAIELAERLVALFPSAARRVLFASDGASAVEAALKIAVQYWHNRGQPEKHRFVSFDAGYHGDTLGSVSVGYIEAFHRPFAPLRFETQFLLPSEQVRQGTRLHCIHRRTRGPHDVHLFRTGPRFRRLGHDLLADATPCRLDQRVHPRLQLTFRQLADPLPRAE